MRMLNTVERGPLGVGDDHPTPDFVDDLEQTVDRLEVQPPTNRKLPQPAESFHQSWSAQSNPPQPQADVPFYPPPVIVAPQIDGPRRDFRN